MIAVRWCYKIDSFGTGREMVLQVKTGNGEYDEWIDVPTFDEKEGMYNDGELPFDDT